MKINLITSELDYRTVIEFESGPYDAVAPIDYLFIENRIRAAHPDRLAIACALLMGRFMSGDVELPKLCSPEVAQGLESFFSPLNVRVSGTEYKPFAKPVGERTALLTLPAVGRDAPVMADLSCGVASSEAITFGLCSDQVFSSSLGISEVRLACNLRAFATGDPASLDLGVLGLCILYAEDFGISRIVFPAAAFHRMHNFNALRRVVMATNIELATPLCNNRDAV